MFLEAKAKATGQQHLLHGPAGRGGPGGTQGTAAALTRSRAEDVKPRTAAQVVLLCVYGAPCTTAQTQLVQTQRETKATG